MNLLEDDNDNKLITVFKLCKIYGNERIFFRKLSK